MFMNYLKAYDSIKKFEEFYHQKQNERQKRIEQVIKVKNKIIQTQQKEQQKLNYKAYSIKSTTHSVNDLVSPKGSTHDISLYDGSQSINRSMMINSFRNKFQLLQVSPQSNYQDEQQEHKLPYMYDHYINQNVQSSPRARANLSQNNDNVLQTLKEYSKQKVYDDIVLASKKKRKIFKQLKNVQNSHSIEHSQAQFDDHRNNKNKLKSPKLEILFDYFFEDTPLLHKIQAQKESKKRKPFLSQSNELNNRIANQIIEAISYREQDEDDSRIKSQTGENNVIPQLTNSVLQSRTDRIPSIINKSQAQTQTTTQTQSNDNLTNFARKEYIPQFYLKDGEENKFKIMISENESPRSNNISKSLSQQILKNNVSNLNNITNQNIANNNISTITNNNNTSQITHISNLNNMASFTQRNSISKEKNIHVENLKSNNIKKKQISQKPINLVHLKEINSPIEFIPQDLQNSSPVSALSNFLTKQQQQPFLSPRNRIGLVKKSLPSLFQTPLPQTKTQAQIQDFNFPSSIQSPISPISNIQTSHSLKPFSVVNKITKK